MIWLFLIAVSLLIIRHYQKHYSLWSKLNIKTPIPLPIIGTTLPMLFDVPAHIDYKRFLRFGRIYGEYLGLLPVLVITDVNLARKVLVSDFHLLHEGQNYLFRIKPFDKMLFMLKGNHWKRIRNAFSPIFSTVKLRHLLDHLDKPIQNIIENLDKQIADGNSGKENLKHLTKGFSLDSIAKYCFGIEINSYKRSNDPFVRYAYRFAEFRGIVGLLDQFLPKFLGDYVIEYLIDPMARKYMYKFATEILKQRKQNPDVKYNDFINMLLNDTKPELTDEEIITQCCSLLFGGLDTISSVLALVIGRLAMHPEYQEKLFNEILNALNDQKNVNYNEINKLVMLDAVLCETLRRTPPVTRAGRIAQLDYQLPGEDIVIKKGQSVHFSLFSIMHDPKHFPEPFAFKPERYLGKEGAELKSKYWIPFSLGPRQCIGMRFALLQSKFVLVHLIYRYQFRLAKNCSDVTLTNGNFLSVPKNCFVEFSHRKNI